MASIIIVIVKANILALLLRSKGRDSIVASDLVYGVVD
jgi:hypothetical protein